ncbi:MAG: Hsp20 family protein [Bdellovibrionota bacterium]
MSTITPITQVTAQPKTVSRAKSASEAAAAEAEKEARTRVVQAQQTTAVAEKEMADRIEHLRDEFEKQYTFESTRLENSLESQKQKGYENLRELRRSMQTEIERVRREGERQLQDMNDYYATTIYRTEKDGNSHLRNTLEKQAIQMNFEENQAQANLDEVRLNSSDRITNFVEQSNAKFAEVSESNRKEFDRMRMNASDAGSESSKRLQEKYANTERQHDETIQKLNTRANNHIKQIRQETSHKLSAYSSRQKDPFYKLLDINARFKDSGDYYELTATIPEHEQQSVSVSVKGDNIVLAGYRRNEEKLDLGEGHKKSSASFQAFNESFPLASSIDKARISKQFDGDKMTVIVPKKNTVPPVNTPKRASEPPARVERPKFPENLNPYKPEDGPRTSKPLT